MAVGLGRHLKASAELKKVRLGPEVLQGGPREA